MTQIDEPNLDEQIDKIIEMLDFSPFQDEDSRIERVHKEIKALISDKVREELTNLKIARLNLDKITTDHADGYQMAIDDMNRHIDNRIKELEESK